jgi:hypothetical protein
MTSAELNSHAEQDVRTGRFSHAALSLDRDQSQPKKERGTVITISWSKPVVHPAHKNREES